jgi:cobalamin biosynthesis protein CbiG
MVGGETVVVAGIGCRRGAAAQAIVAVLREAEALAGPVQMLAAPAFKRDEPGLREAAALLHLELLFIDDAALQAAQAQCVTRSAIAARATGFASVAEAAAIGAGGVLVLPRLTGAGVTCALARR